MDNTCSDVASSDNRVLNVEPLTESTDLGVNNQVSGKRVSEIVAKGQGKTQCEGRIKEKFDYKKYQRRPQDYVAALGSKKILSNIPVKKPDKTSWVKVHPEIEVPVGVYEDKANREYFLVDPDVYDDFGANLVPALLFLAQTRLGDQFFWLVKSSATGRGNRWAESSLEAVKLGQKTWVRVEADLAAGGYNVYVPATNPPDAEWDEVDLNNLLEEAFRGRIIDNPDHPIILNLKGKF